MAGGRRPDPMRVASTRSAATPPAGGLLDAASLMLSGYA